MITSNFEITENLKDCSHFLGCFLLKNLPSFPQNFPASLILNIEGHWVAIYLLEDNCLYFDSFGNRKERLSHNLLNFLNKYTNILVNVERVQDYFSFNCAEFCLSFIKNVYSPESYRLFLENFDIKNRKNNNKIVKHLCK